MGAASYARVIPATNSEDVVVIDKIAAPVYTSVSPDTGSDAGGETIAITGEHLNAITSVKIGGTSCTSIVHVSDTTLTCITPAKAAGSYGIVIAGSGGSASSANPNEFTFTSGAFDPASLALTGWWRGSYSGVPWTPTASAGTSGSNGNLDQASDPQKPAAGAALNGFTPADFDGGDVLSGTADVLDLLSNGASTFVCLFYADAAAVDSGAGAYYNNPSFLGDGNTMALTFSADGVRLGYYDGAMHDSVAAACATGGWHLAMGYWNGTTLSIQVDSGAPTTVARGAASLTSPATCYMGYDRTNLNFYDGKVMELMVSDQDLSASFSDIKTYINDRYGLAL